MDNTTKTQKKYNKEIADWEAEAKKNRAEGKRIPSRPNPPLGFGHPHTPSALYNGMIAPIVPYAIRGVIWYQGESNSRRAYQYRSLFPAMIANWRYSWNQGSFPFLFVQLANYVVPAELYREVKMVPYESTWAELREAQLMVLNEKNTGMAVTIDIGEADNIHPKNKQAVGYRLSLAASAIAYGKDIIYSGPIYKSIRIEGNKACINFNYTGSGLLSKGGDLKGFTIAGKDRRFVDAVAIIEGNTVVVTSPEIHDPVAVRYGWADNPECNLFNKEGLPASPFRTDIWPGITRKARSDKEFIENYFPNLLLGRNVLPGKSKLKVI